VHTTDELSDGAKMAWRNAALHRPALLAQPVVLDRRRLAPPTRFSRCSCTTCTPPVAARSAGDRIFAAAQPGQPFRRVWNEQLIRYAGYRAGRPPIGDLRLERFPAAMRGFGCQGKGRGFGPPLAVDATEGVRLYELPERSIRECRSPSEFGGSPSWGCAGTPSRRSPTCG